jgi:hypothetical protein
MGRTFHTALVVRGKNVLHCRVIWAWRSVFALPSFLLYRDSPLRILESRPDHAEVRRRARTHGKLLECLRPYNLAFKTRRQESEFRLGWEGAASVVVRRSRPGILHAANRMLVQCKTEEEDRAVAYSDIIVNRNSWHQNDKWLLVMRQQLF